MSLFGMFLYWTGGWGSAAIIVFIIVANQLTKYDLLGSQSRAFGLNYTAPKAAYNNDALQTIASDSNIVADKQYFIHILNNWKAKNIDSLHPERKPVMVFINVSGGGIRAAMFSTCIMQACDSLMQGQLFDKTFLISGASGGMMGATYMRDLFLKKKEGFAVKVDDPIHQSEISKDLLNPMALSILSNDALFPYHKFKVGDNSYYKDRGYIFEKTYCRNTGFRFDKTIGDYRQSEYDAKIPLLVYHTTIMNDSRRFYISPQPCSFLMRPQGKNAIDNRLDIDAVDFCHLFSKQGGQDLLVTSAMRMDATFPFLFPNPVLPTNPPTYVMDGGALDNFGVETTIRFLKTFQDWINENTSGIVVIQVRDEQKMKNPEVQVNKTLFSRLVDPVGTVYTNMEKMQDYLTDYRLDDLDQDLRGKLHFVLFEYISEKKDDKAAMSMHITARDKDDITRSIQRRNNKLSFERLRLLMSE